MPPRTPEQFEAMRSSRREQIMEAALELFAREGYGNCSISQLATHAGISKGLMYNYFDSKEQLLAAIIENGLTEIMGLLDPDHDGVLQPEEMAGFIQRILSAMRGNQKFWTLYVTVILQPHVREILAGGPFQNYIERFGPLLMDYFQRMGFQNPELEMLTFSAMIEGLGVLLIYAHPYMEFSEELLKAYEKRIIKQFTQPGKNQES
jgi:AcrR family transcriptional regulator